MGAIQKTVCIVGAGPSGLVAAKTLLHDARARGLFAVTIVEAQPRVGGLWPSGPEDGGGLVHPQMQANQSRHTMQFSDLAWTSEEEEDDGEDSVPELPRAWQVGRYLQRYYERYLAGSGNDCKLRLGTRVARTEPVDGGGGGWHVWVRPEGDRTEQAETADEDAGVFDYLVVASGFFGSPLIPEGVKLQSAATADSRSVPVVHSSQYRSLATLLPKADGPETSHKGTILVVGGQMSGVEIAGTIANDVSTARHCPRPSPFPEADELQVHHLIQKPTWMLPLYTTPTPAAPAPSFYPIDVTSWNLRRRRQPLTDTGGHVSAETARTVHEALRSQAGSDQADLAPALAMQGDAVLDSPPFLALSDTYAEHVRSGLVTVSRGWLSRVEGREAVVEGQASAAGTTITPTTTLPDIAAVVLATGFSPATSLAFLPPAVKTALAFDPADARHSVALAFHGSCHPAVARLVFVGFYRAPYWGVMEMQARAATALFVSAEEATTSSSGSPGSSGSWYPPTPRWPGLSPALQADTDVARTLALRRDPRAAQFPMGDYMYHMEAMAAALGLTRRQWADEDALGVDMVTPAHYVVEDGDSAASAERSLRHTADVLQRGRTQVAGVARAVFRCLQGRWRLTRQLTSARPSHPSGQFVGTAEFRLRGGTADGESAHKEEANPLEYLYVEDGTFTAASGLVFRATRRYVWRYDVRLDRLSVWFVRTDDDRRADYLFHALAFAPGPAGWRATAGHLCIDDFYDVQYDFVFAGVALRSWRLRYAVKGPNKDYTIDGTYRRLQPGEE